MTFHQALISLARIDRMSVLLEQALGLLVQQTGADRALLVVQHLYAPHLDWTESHALDRSARTALRRWLGTAPEGGLVTSSLSLGGAEPWPGVALHRPLRAGLGSLTLFKEPDSGGFSDEDRQAVGAWESQLSLLLIAHFDRAGGAGVAGAARDGGILLGGMDGGVGFATRRATPSSNGSAYGEAVHALERRLLRRVLAERGWDVFRAAASVGVDPVELLLRVTKSAASSATEDIAGRPRHGTHDVDQEDQTPTEETRMTLPSVFAYLDYALFIRDWMEAKKASYGQLARWSGPAGERLSRGTICKLAKGNYPKPSKDVLDRLARAMKLEGEERAFLGLLVALAVERNPAIRSSIRDQILEVRAFRKISEGVDEAKLLRFYGEWQHSAIAELTRCAGFRDDPVWIASRLCPQISVGDVRRALARMLELGLLKKDASGVLRPQAPQMATAPAVQHQAAIEYHRDMLQQARAALLLPQKERTALAATMAIPASMRPAIEKEFYRLFQKLNHMIQASTEEKGEVWQLNLYNFPLARMEAGDDDEASGEYSIAGDFEEPFDLEGA